MSDAGNNGSIPQGLLDEIRKKAIEEVAKYAILDFVGFVAIAATGWWLYIKQNLSDWVSGIPRDAGLVFDGIVECPTGWDRLRKAEGRYLVGAWPGIEAGREIGIKLEPDENRTVGRHTHLVNSAGGHAHKIIRASGNGNGNYVKLAVTGDGDAGMGGEYGVSRDGEHAHTIVDSGSKDGTNAPYMTFLVCKKKRDP